MTVEALTGLVADTAAHFISASTEIENALFEINLPARGDTSRPGSVLDGQTVRVYRSSGLRQNHYPRRFTPTLEVSSVTRKRALLCPAALQSVG
jgi:hypothetical protein